MTDSPAERLYRTFDKYKATPAIGGYSILEKLGKLAAACVIGKSNSQDAVAFALAQIFLSHAEDRYERIVTGNDTYILMASGDEHLSDAVNFIEKGGSAEDATRIISALARLTPDHLRGQ